MRATTNLTQAKCHGKCVDTSSFTVYCKYGRWKEESRDGRNVIRMSVWCDKYNGWHNDVKGLR